MGVDFAAGAVVAVAPQPVDFCWLGLPPQLIPRFCPASYSHLPLGSHQTAVNEATVLLSAQALPHCQPEAHDGAGAGAGCEAGCSVAEGAETHEQPQLPKALQLDSERPPQHMVPVKPAQLAD